MNGRYSLAGTHIGVAVAAFGLASIMGLLQALSLSDVQFPHRSESLYYISVTAHGVLMALVFTTFFIMGLGYVLAQEELGRILAAVSPGSAFGSRLRVPSQLQRRFCAGKAPCSIRFIRRYRRIRCSTSGLHV